MVEETPAEGAQVGFLDGVPRQFRVAQDPAGDGIGHRLRRLDQPPARTQVAAASQSDKVFHFLRCHCGIALPSKTRRPSLCDTGGLQRACSGGFDGSVLGTKMRP